MKSIAFRLVFLLGLLTRPLILYAALPLEASMDIVSTAAFDNAVDIDRYSDEWGVILSPLGVKTSAVMLNASSQLVVEAGATGEARWTDASHGNVDFDDIGWTFYTDGPNGASHASFGSYNWRYRFLAETDGYFRINADVTGQGSDLFGLNGFSIVLSGGPEGARFIDHLDPEDPTTTWNFEASLTEGSVYTASLYMASNISGGGARTASMSGQFAWQITPEPTSLVLLGTSIIAVFVLKRR